MGGTSGRGDGRFAIGPPSDETEQRSSTPRKRRDLRSEINIRNRWHRGIQTLAPVPSVPISTKRAPFRREQRDREFTAVRSSIILRPWSGNQDKANASSIRALGIRAHGSGCVSSNGDAGDAYAACRIPEPP